MTERGIFRSAPVFKTGLFFIGQATLWLVGGLALFGSFQPRETIPPDGAASFVTSPAMSLMTLALAVWSGALLCLCHASDRPDLGKNIASATGKIRFHGILVPALLVGLLLPFPWIVPYGLLLVFFEAAWSLRTVYSTWYPLRETTVLPVSEHAVSEPVANDNFDEIDDFEPFDEENVADFDENTTQQIVRRRTAEGKDRLEGTFLIDYADDQLTATIHVPFCPAFGFPPAIETYLLDETEAKITVVHVQLFGTRIDVKRAKDAPKRLRVAVVAEESNGISKRCGD